MNRIELYLFFLLFLVAGCTRVPEQEINPKVIILMYHRISAGEAGNLYERSTADFEGDLKYLHDNNIRVIGFADLANIVNGDEQLMTDAVIITFDDGDHSWYTRAVPLLKQYKMKATFFLWVSKIGTDSFVTWDEVELLSNYADGNGERPFVFGSHSLSHQYMLAMKSVLGDGAAYEAYLDEEIGRSKDLIDAHIYGTVDALSLPFGDGAGDADIIAAAERHGYRFIRTSEWGATGITGTDLYRLPSLPILDDTDPSLIGDYLGR
jgi:peptidoglycan/xylan/chitin deacetylase (PgdA/CDA1 family)